MKKEEQDLLVKDISARLYYGVKVNNEIQGDFVIYGVCEDYIFVRNTNSHVDFHIEKIKPYLFPMSSMTEEQKKEFHGDVSILNAFIDGSISLYENEELTPEDIIEIFDFLNRNHFDYRGLIPMGLAIDATGKNIY